LLLLVTKIISSVRATRLGPRAAIVRITKTRDLDHPKHLIC
jgi:hypothetical protein